MDEDGADLARLLAQFNLEEVRDAIPDDQFLNILNELRVLEKRPVLEKLPADLIILNKNQRFEWVKRITKEIQVHGSLEHTEDPQILLNKTELRLLSLNRSILTSVDTVPITYLPYGTVDPDDLAFYYPATTDKEQNVFVTDSDCRLISTATYITSGQCFLSKHNLGVVFSTETRILPFESFDLLTSTPIRIDDTVSSTSSTSSVSTLTSSQEQAEWQRQYYRTVNKHRKHARKRMATDEPSISNVDEGSLARITALEEENANLLRKVQEATASKTGPLPKAKSEREEINEMKKTMEMLIKKLETGMGLDAHSSLVDKNLLEVIQAPENYMSVMYKLKYPENLLDISDAREAETLAILKPSVIANTIGIFDPDTNPKVEFRGLWERILEHTKNAQLYEHEYLTCLRMVMKGSAAMALDKMTKEFEGDLAQILEAIQDLYIPQMTFFDEYDELNNFVRNKNEHIRTTVRRASLAVYTLKDTVTPAAWPDRRYTLLMQIIKQVIDKRTFKHLRMEELKCAHAGTQLTIPSVVGIIGLYESTHNLIPIDDVKLSYNVNTMQLANQPDRQTSEIEELREQVKSLTANVKSLAPKRVKFDKTIPADRPKARGRRRLDTSKTQYPTQNPQQQYQTRGVKRAAEADKPSQQQQQTYPVVPYQPPKNNYNNQQMAPRSNTQPYRQQGFQTQQAQQYRQGNQGGYRQPYQTAYKQQGQARYQSPGRYRNNYQQGYRGNNYRGRGRGRRTQRSYNFRRDKGEPLTINVYTCAVCNGVHEEGTECPLHPGSGGQRQNLNG